MKPRIGLVAGTSLTLAILALPGCGASGQATRAAADDSAQAALSEPEQTRIRRVRRGIIPGESGSLGSGQAEAFAHFTPQGELIRMGFIFSASLIEDPPTVPNPEGSAFDVDGDGKIGPNESLGEYRLTLDMPDAIVEWDAVPFKWIEVKWRPTVRPGEDPPWPHFEFLFYTAPKKAIEAIRPGACGVLIDCDDFKAATRPVPSKYVPRGYEDQEFAFPLSGNHLADTLQEGPPDPDGHFNFTYGAYDGEIVFYGPKLTVDFLKLKQNLFLDIALPEAWAVSGYYPTAYGTHYGNIRNQYIITLEKFVYREAG